MRERERGSVTPASRGTGQLTHTGSQEENANGMEWV